MLMDEIEKQIIILKKKLTQIKIKRMRINTEINTNWRIQLNFN
jgi:hypothetical protein